MRLPKCVLPRRYDLELWTDLETCEFTGKVVASLHIVEACSSFTLNVADLTIDSVSFHYEGEIDKVLIPSCVVDAENETLSLHFEGNSDLKLGNSYLCIEYHGLLNEKLDGFYKGTYESCGLVKNMAVTTFEPADARRFFPCWDEPDFKANFTFKVHAPADRIVLSNMPVKNEAVIGKIKTVEFEESPLMSTYIIAIVIGEFEYMEAISDDGIPVRVYTLQGELHKGKYGMDIILKLLPFFAEFFQLRYPLPKLDIVSVPQFKAGALENFGCVVFRDLALLVDEKSSASQRQGVAIDVAHELAHMWFGNIVTLEWWTHLWLNEGMATWISYLAVDYLFPEFEIWMDFDKVIRDAFRMDAMVESHPVEVEVGHVRETDSVFDAISYCKGASLVYMLQDYLGLRDVKEGLRAYISKFSFGNAKSEDLWESFEQATGKPVKELMNCWTKQKGYPVIHATRLNDHSIAIEQSQFLASGKEGEGLWPIPVKLSSELDDEHMTVLVTEKNSVIPFNGSWVKLNAGQAGFYRVKYDDELQRMLEAPISLKLLSSIDRLGILDDSFALYKAGKQPLTALLTLLQAYALETDPTILSMMVQVSMGVSTAVRVAIPALSSKVDSYLAKLLEHPAKQISWENVDNESHRTSIARSVIWYALVVLGHTDAVLEALKRFETRSISPDNMKAVYASVMKDSTCKNRVGYDALVDMYKASDSLEEKQVILRALGSSSDPEMVIEALQLCLSHEVLPQDMYLLFAQLSESNSVLAWSWVKENWEKVYKRLGDGFMMARLLNAASDHIWDDKVADDFSDFLSSRCGKLEKRVAGMCENIHLRAHQCLLLLDKQPQLAHFLETNVK